jgi:ATP-dependent helicase/DNAse subunit B
MLNQIKNKMKQDPLGDPIVLIAPTQSTFQLEQAFSLLCQTTNFLKNTMTQSFKVKYFSSQTTMMI